MTQNAPRGEWEKVATDEAAVGQRLDQWLAGQLTELSRSRVAAEIKAGAVRVNGKPSLPSHKLRPGERVDVAVALLTAGPPEVGVVKPTPMKLDIVYEDDALLVVNKRAGLVTHPAPGHDEGTLANGLVARYGPEMAAVGGPARSGIVHRLDQLTTGLLVVARTAAAHEALTSDLAERKVQRRYLAVTLGTFKASEGVIEAPIARKPNDRRLMGVVKGGRAAKTSYRIVLDNEGVALALIRLHTGRTHQIRVHFQSINRPVLGDPVYGWTRPRFLQSVSATMKPRLGPAWPHRQMLHAAGLRFDHPVTGETMEFFAPMPLDMCSLIDIVFGPGHTDQSDAVRASFELEPEPDAAVEAVAAAEPEEEE